MRSEPLGGGSRSGYDIEGVNTNRMLSTYQLPVNDSGRQGRLARTIALVVILVIAATLLPVGARAQDTSSNLVYFDGTGQTLGGAFYDGWLAQGGLAEAGAPISPAVQHG